MRIARIECFGLEAPIQEPFRFSQAWVTTRRTVLVCVESADGLEGWGEVFCQVPPVVYTTLISEVLAPHLIGANPWDREVLWQRLYSATIDCGQRGLVVGALSGLDIALWDLIGHDSGQPIHRLLGGLARSEVEAYATGLYRKPGDSSIDDLAGEAISYVEMGFRTLKMKVGFGVQEDIAAVKSVRAAIGPEISLAVDANHAYLPHQAITLGRTLAPLNIAWFEEPVSPEDLAGYAEVRAQQPIPIAGGELHFTRFGFRELLERRAMDILQPDIGLCGGLSEGRVIAAMARASNTACWAHVWGTAVAQAASLQFLGSLPTITDNDDLTAPLMEWDCTTNPLRESVVSNPPRFSNGSVSVPTEPGLGVSIVRNALAQFQTNKSSIGPALVSTIDRVPSQHLRVDDEPKASTAVKP